jgi:prepilin-type N-terminal cleavage/methylation domain-containing protein/prepilin-type processing-associated H-X9-DG protein
MQSLRNHSRSRHRGFTLIELLVVIAIIAILAAILFPVFAQAREKARQTSCLSNNKQIALSVLMYVQDYDEMFPISRWWPEYDPATPGKDKGWAASVQPYIKNLGVFKCPSDGQGLAPAPDSSGWCGVYLSYVGNAYHAGWNGTSAFALGPIGYIGASWMDPSAVGLAKMNRPADTILTAEKFAQDNVSNGVVQFPGANCSAGWPTGDVITANLGDFAQQIPDGTRDPAAAYPNGRNGGVTAKHSDHANFAFVDGHVKSMVPYATNPDPVNRPQDNMWDGTRQ